MRRLVGLAVLILVTSSLSIGVAYDVEAGPGKKADRSSRAEAPGSSISREQAAAIARSATGGRVLNIQLMRGNRPMYSVKMLLDGKRVRTLGVDARTGAILR